MLTRKYVRSCNRYCIDSGIWIRFSMSLSAWTARIFLRYRAEERICRPRRWGMRSGTVSAANGNCPSQPQLPATTLLRRCSPRGTENTRSIDTQCSLSRRKTKKKKEITRGQSHCHSNRHRPRCRPSPASVRSGAVASVFLDLVCSIWPDRRSSQAAARPR